MGLWSIFSWKKGHSFPYHFWFSPLRKSIIGTDEGNGKQRQKVLHYVISKLGGGCWKCNVEVREGLSQKLPLPGLWRVIGRSLQHPTAGFGVITDDWLHHLSGTIPFYLILRGNGAETCYFNLQKFYLSKFIRHIYQRDRIISEKYSDIEETKIMALANSIFSSISKERLPKP